MTSQLQQAEGYVTQKNLDKRPRVERNEASSQPHAFRQLLLGNGTHQVEQTGQNKTSQQAEPAITHSSTQSPVNLPEPTKSPRKLIPEEDALRHIRCTVQAIMSFNDQDGRAFDDKWYISFPVVQTLLKVNGMSANQKNVSVVFEEMKQELVEHHEKHAIGSRHNHKHPKIESDY